MDTQVKSGNTITNKVPGLRRTHAMLSSMFDMLTVGVACVRKNGGLMYANQSALNMLGHCGILVNNDEVPHIENRINEFVLRRLNFDSNQTTVIRRQNIELQIQIQPFPNPRTNLLFDVERRHGAMLILHETGRIALPSIEQLNSLYGLTYAEARLALAICKGETPAECAETLGVCITTVRSQLRAVLEKTGSHRQTELVTKLLTSPSASIRAI